MEVLPLLTHATHRDIAGDVAACIIGVDVNVSAEDLVRDCFEKASKAVRTPLTMMSPAAVVVDCLEWMSPLTHIVPALGAIAVWLELLGARGL